MAERVRARRLTDQEGQWLQQIVRRGKHGSVRMRRAMIIMASASGTPVPAIARLVAADEDTVRDVIHAFNEKGLTALDPRWAGGRPRLISDAGHRGHRRGGHHPAGEAGPAVHALELAQADSAPGLAGYPDRARTAAADPARPEDLLPAHEDLEGVRRPGPGRQAGPDRARDQPLSWTGASPLTSSGRYRSGPPTAPAGPGRTSRYGCRPPITAPTGSATSTAATPSAMTGCGASPACVRAATTP